MKLYNIVIFAVALMKVLGIPCEAGTISWTNAAGGSWNTPANWDANRVPGVSDNVIITANGTYTITIDAFTEVFSLTLGGTNGQQTILDEAYYWLDLDGPSVVNANGILDLANNGLGGNGMLTVCGLYNWNYGWIHIANGVTVAPTGVMNVIGGFLGLSCVLTNQGTVNWLGGEPFIQNNGAGDTGAISNQTGGVWNIQCDSTLNCTWGIEQFYNSGVILKSASGGVTAFDVYVDNSGAAETQNGTVEFNWGGVLGGRFVADSGTTISCPLFALTASHGGSASASSFSAVSNFTSVTLQAYPSTGYTFSSWEANTLSGGSFSQTASNQTTFRFNANSAYITAAFAPIPSLAVGRSGQSLVLLWPTNSPGYQLQSTGLLGSSTNWAPLINTPVLTLNGQNIVVTSSTNRYQFFRLSSTN